MKPITLYAVVSKVKPKLTYQSLIQCCDKDYVKIRKDEKLVKVVINVVK